MIIRKPTQNIDIIVQKSWKSRKHYLQKTTIGDVSAGQMFEGIRGFDILVRYQKQDRDSIEAIRNIFISGPDGIKTPLAQIANIEGIVGSRQITRENI